MPNELRMIDMQWARLRDHLLADDDDEHAALLICGHQATPDGTILLVREVVPLGPVDLEPGGGQFHLRVSPAAVARWAKRARLADGTIVLCHSHPFGKRVRPSKLDLRTERDLCGRVLATRLAPRPVGALILGPSGFDGRVWHRGGNSQSLDRLRVLGEGVITQPAPTAQPDDAVARQVLAWSQGGQARLAASRVAVVGVGGTGSQVAMQLAHLRVGSVVLVDDDEVEASNLSRLLGATPAHVGQPKVSVVGAAMRAIHPGIEVEMVDRSVLEIDAAARLAGMDLIMCCTDGHGSRALLTELCVQHLVPVIDLGVEIQPREPAARVGGGVRVLRPGGWCLHCARTLSPALVREEFLSDDELRRERDRGYIRGSQTPDPSVVALNGVAASLAVLEACSLLAGFLPPLESRLLYVADERRLGTASVARRTDCYVCGDGGLLALGDARRLPRRAARRPAA